MDDYEENLTLNLGTDIVGVVVTMFVIGPLISRAQEGRVREHTGWTTSGSAPRSTARPRT